MRKQTNRDQIETRVYDAIKEILIHPSSRERHNKLSQLINIISSTGTDFNSWVQSIKRKDLRDLLAPLAEALSVQEVPDGKPLIESIFQHLSEHRAIALFVEKEEPTQGILVPINVLIMAGEGRSIVIPQALILEQAMSVIRTSVFRFINELGWFGRHDNKKYNIYVHLGEPINTPPLDGNLDGPSLGLLIGILVVCHFCGSTLPPGTSATGELTTLSRVVPVAGVHAKVRAAVEEGNIIQVFTPELNDEEKEDLGNYLSFVEDVGSLEKAINILLHPSYPPWYIKNHMKILREHGIDPGEFRRRKVGLLGKKMSLHRATEEASFRIALVQRLKGVMDETDQVLSEIFAYYLENAEKEGILPVLIDLGRYGWGKYVTLIDLVRAELDLPEQSASFIEDRIKAGELMLLCRNAPHNNALKAALAAELESFGDGCKLVIRHQALPDGSLNQLAHVRILRPITKREIRLGIPAVLIVFTLSVLLAVIVLRDEKPTQGEIATQDFWEPFRDGAVLVMAEAPLIFTGPDALHEIPEGPLRLEVIPPDHPRDIEAYRDKGDFKTLREVLRDANSETMRNDIEKFYSQLQPYEIVPYYVIPTSGYTGIGDARGIAEVMATLLRIKPELALFQADTLPGLRVETDASVINKINERAYHEENLVVFGGAGSNAVTRHFDALLDRFAPKQRYHHGPPGKPGDVDGMDRMIAYYSAEDQKDCGSLVYLPPNFLGKNNPHGHIVIFDGYENPGTLAATYITTRPILRILQQINAQKQKHQAIQLEIQVGKVVDGREPVLSSIELVEGSFMRFTLGELQQ